MKKQVKPTCRQTKTGNAVLKETASPQTDDSRGADQSFPLVGIGTSAGGLEALALSILHDHHETGRVVPKEKGEINA
jgi:chemotaxis response regulator CheB